MHKAWEDDSPRARFWSRLVRQRAEQFMRDEEYLRSLRHRNEFAKHDQKLFGAIWAEHGTNVYKLIAGACGEVWDDEDEEKNASREKNIAAITQREDDNLAPAREGGPQGGQHQLQGIAQASERLVEGEKGQGPEKGPEKGCEGGACP